MSAANVVVAYHSGYGHTRALANEVAEGARQAGAQVALVQVQELSEADWSALDAADAIVFGSPTYMGSASAGFQTFAEASSRRMMAHAWEGKLAAGFTVSASKSGDKVHTLQAIAVFAAQHAMHWVSLGLLPGWNASGASEEDLNRLGFFLGAGAQANADQGEEGVTKADRETAKHLGSRVAGFAQVVAAGRAALAQ